LSDEQDQNTSIRMSIDTPDRPGKKRRIRRQHVFAVLPSLFTLGNVLCGFLAMFFASRPMDAHFPFGWTPLVFGAMFIFLGMLFDGVDGRVARLTNQTSKFGEQLDSMADMITFGVAPAFLAFRAIEVGTIDFLRDPAKFTAYDRTTLVVGCIYVACAALRLARYNVEAGQVDEDDDDSQDPSMTFKGLPSPGAAGAVAGAVLLHQHFELHKYLKVDDAGVLPWQVIGSAIAIVAIMGLCALAMVSRFRYVHMLNRYVRGRDRFENIVKIVVAVLLFLMEPWVAIAGAFAVYALSAPVAAAWHRVWGKRGGQRQGTVGDGDGHEKREVG